MIVFNHFPTDIQNYERINIVTEVTNKSISDKIMVRKIDIIDKINALSDLQENWDGFGAEKIESKIINNTKKVLTNLSDNIFSYLYDIDVYPNTNGTITLDFKSISNDLLSIEIGQENISGFILKNNSETILLNCDEITSKKNYEDFLLSVKIFNL
jgi:hypothetical protein